jgi:hypothetical protein
MDKPPKLGQLLFFLAAVIAAILFLHYLSTTLPGAK